jgi:hypothetical protein
MPPKELIHQFCRESSHSENAELTAFLYDEKYAMNVYDVIQKCIDWNNKGGTPNGKMYS